MHWRCRVGTFDSLSNCMQSVCRVEVCTHTSNYIFDQPDQVTGDASSWTSSCVNKMVPNKLMATCGDRSDSTWNWSLSAPRLYLVRPDDLKLPTSKHTFPLTFCPSISEFGHQCTCVMAEDSCKVVNFVVTFRYLFTCVYQCALLNYLRGFYKLVLLLLCALSRQVAGALN